MTGMKFDLSFAGDVSHKGHYSNMQLYPVALGDQTRLSKLDTWTGIQEDRHMGRRTL